MVLTVIALPAYCLATEGFNGTIYFRNEDSVAFDHIGNQDYVYRTKIEGKFGAKEVEYRFHEFKEIVFADKNNRYGGLSSSGPHDPGSITYTYNDTIDQQCMYLIRSLVKY